MKMSNLKFKNRGCFSDGWAGFDEVKPINIIIGRNNTGKSQLLELVKVMCEGLSAENLSGMEFECYGTFDVASLRTRFPETHSGGNLDGNHWRENGEKFIDVPIVWDREQGWGARNLRFPDGYTHPEGGAVAVLTEKRAHVLASILEATETPLQGMLFRHLFADRDIRLEESNVELRLSSDGAGATNIIQKFITSSRLPRDLIQTQLLAALNEVFGQDGHFTEIQVRQHDDRVGSSPWEVYLGEEKKGLVPLSRSGSGLKTVILVLLFLFVAPKIDGRAIDQYVFAFEELENNLHPALLRRLLTFVERFAVSNKTPVFLTTHSSAVLDMFGASDTAQIVHVTHNRASAIATTVKAHFDRLGVLSELGAKPSDLLQANGVIWVEGPSDAIYITKWIELVSEGALKEGRDFICAFYGGALLARTQFVAPEQALDEMVNLIRLNPNVVVVCDGDRTSPGAHLKPRVRRIKDELEQVPKSFCWVTSPKEIESYLPGSAFKRALGLNRIVRDPQQYEKMFPGESRDGTSFIEDALGVAGIDKIDLASKVVAQTSVQEMSERFDWQNRMASVVQAVQGWGR